MTTATWSKCGTSDERSIEPLRGCECCGWKVPRGKPCQHCAEQGLPLTAEERDRRNYQLIRNGLAIIGMAVLLLLGATVFRETEQDRYEECLASNDGDSARDYYVHPAPDHVGPEDLPRLQQEGSRCAARGTCASSGLYPQIRSLYQCGPLTCDF
jgi:hypothetical protein